MPVKVFAGSVLAAGLLLGAAPMAHADRDSFMQYIRDRQINTAHYPEANIVASGIRACEVMRQGMNADEISQGLSIVDARGIADAAQHELCPDTLR